MSRYGSRNVYSPRFVGAPAPVPQYAPVSYGSVRAAPVYTSAPAVSYATTGAAAYTGPKWYWRIEGTNEWKEGVGAPPAATAGTTTTRIASAAAPAASSGAATTSDAPKVKVVVLFFSAYGHVYKLAEAEAAGAREVEGVEAVLYRAPNLLSDEVLEKTGVKGAQGAFKHVPELTHNDLDVIRGADLVLFGISTKYGMMASEMKAVLDGWGALWMDRSLVGKLAGVFCATATQHGGNEAAIRSMQGAVQHFGFVLGGLPYTYAGQMGTGEVTGGSPYGASTHSDGNGARQPSENELNGAKFQGKHLAQVASDLVRGRALRAARK